MDGRVSDLMDGGRMALDNKTSLLNTPLLSSSPRGAREHFSDSPFKHSRKDTSLDDSEQLTDGTQTHSDKKKNAYPLYNTKISYYEGNTMFCFFVASKQRAAWTSRSWWLSC